VVKNVTSFPLVIDAIASCLPVLTVRRRGSGCNSTVCPEGLLVVEE